MLPLRIAVATRSFGQPLKTAVRTASDIEADGVQFEVRQELKPADLTDTGRRQFLHMLGELGLSVASLEFPARRAFYDPDQLDARIAAAKETMTFAYDLGANVVTSRVGRIPQDEQSPEYGVLQEALGDLARHANRVGATLAITPTGESAERLAKLVGSIDEGPIGVNFDPAVFVVAGHDPADALRTLYQLVTHVVVRDAVREADGTGIEVPVGRGEVPWDELLAMLDEAGYHGWLTVERTQGDDKAADMGRAIQYLRRVAAG